MASSRSLPWNTSASVRRLWAAAIPSATSFRPVVRSTPPALNEIVHSPVVSSARAFAFPTGGSGFGDGGGAGAGSYDPASSPTPHGDKTSPTYVPNSFVVDKFAPEAVVRATKGLHGSLLSEKPAEPEAVSAFAAAKVDRVKEADKISYHKSLNLRKHRYGLCAVRARVCVDSI